MFFQVNTHLTPRPILLTRHGESRDNVRGRIGGDTVLRLDFRDIFTWFNNLLENFKCISDFLYFKSDICL